MFLLVNMKVILILLATIVFVNGQQKMMKIFGKVLDVDLDEVTKTLEPVSNIKCVDDCFQTKWCILVFMNSEGKCFNFDFNSTKKLTVVETKREEGLMVAFKTRFLLDQCPAYDDMDLVVTVGRDPIPWIKNGNEYTFKKCDDYHKMFKRENGVVVCMYAYTPGNDMAIAVKDLEKAKKKCQSNNHQLTGLQSEEEVQWLFDLIRSNKTFGMWINARRQEEYSGLNDTHFNITDGYTTLDQEFYRKFADLSGISDEGIPEDCLMVSKASPGFLMHDVPCENNEYGKVYVCGYLLE